MISICDSTTWTEFSLSLCIYIYKHLDATTKGVYIFIEQSIFKSRVSSEFLQRTEVGRVISVGQDTQYTVSYPLTILLANFACPSTLKFPSSSPRNEHINFPIPAPSLSFVTYSSRLEFRFQESSCRCVIRPFVVF